MRWRSGALVVLALAVGCTAEDDPTFAEPAVGSTSAPATSTTAVGAGCERSEVPPAREGLDQIVHVLLYCDDALDPADARMASSPRVVPADRTAIDATMLQVFLDETAAEEAAGLAGIGDAYLGATYLETVVADGVATIRLRESFAFANNLGTSTASAFAYHQIERNVFRFEEVHGLEYEVGGERWCGFENTCDGGPFPYFTRGAAEPRPPETCMRAWDDGVVAPIECEAYPEAYRAVTSTEPPVLADRSFTIAEVVVAGGALSGYVDADLELAFTADSFELQTPCSPVSGRYEVHEGRVWIWGVAAGGIDDCTQEQFEQMGAAHGVLGDRPVIRHDEGELTLERDGDRIVAVERG